MDVGNDKRAEGVLRDVIDSYPEHIDAIHHLAVILDRGRRKEEAKQLWEQAVDLGKKCFPTNFKPGEDKLEWGWLENRPFLRAYYGLGLVFLREERFQEALNVFKDIINLNPNDNQGARALVIECYLALKNPEGVLSVRKQYENDCMVDTVYGEVLALFQLNRLAEAKKALKEAIKYSPLVAKELVKLKHPPVTPSSSYGVAVGGPDEAYEYWESCGKFWEETEGAVEFIKNNM